MEIKTIKQMLRYRNHIVNELKIQSTKLDRLSFFSDKDEKERIKNRIKKLNRDLDDVERVMVTGASFKTEDFVEFLTAFLTLTEENTISTRIILNNDYDNDDDIFVRMKDRKLRREGRRFESERKVHYFISNEVLRSIILEHIFEKEDLERFLNTKLKDQTIYLDSYYTYPFEKDLSMSKQFAKHTRLKTAIYELIQLKIRYPKLTDKERFDIVLNNTVERNKRRSYENEKELTK